MNMRFVSVSMWVAGLLLALLTPVFGSPTMVDITFRTCSLVVLAVSWNLMASAGLISLGHSAFFGLGGYAAILAANSAGTPFWLSLLGALVAGAILGLGLALITGKMRGIYFAITTLAVSEGLRVIAVMLPDLTGGAKGAYLAPDNFPGAFTVNMAMGIAAVGTCLIAWAISRSRYHFAFRAMRANEGASQMLGIYPLKYRAAITAISGSLASLVGGVEVWHGGYIDPALAFDLHITITSQIAPILGGIYTLAGPVLGAVATTLIGDATRIGLGHIEGASLLVFGLILVGCVLYLPQGIRGGIAQFLDRRSNRSAGSKVTSTPMPADTRQQ
jgi:branched-chain amino acid transport system permease protein